MKADLSQRVALVTGSAKGIGRAIVLRFAENGTDVNDLDESQAGKTAEEIKALGTRSMFVQLTWAIPNRSRRWRRRS